MNSLHRALISRFDEMYRTWRIVHGHLIGVWKKYGMKKTVTLDELEWGQIIDGLSYRVEVYENAIRYYEEGSCEGKIAEVSDGDEAERLATWYRELIQKIVTQTRAL